MKKTLTVIFESLSLYYCFFLFSRSLGWPSSPPWAKLRFNLV